MNTKDEGVLVKLVKKAVGLPTKTSSCGCAPIESTSNACCSTEAPVSASTDCGCNGTAQADDEHPSEA